LSNPALPPPAFPNPSSQRASMSLPHAEATSSRPTCLSSVAGIAAITEMQGPALAAASRAGCGARLALATGLMPFRPPPGLDLPPPPGLDIHPPSLDLMPPRDDAAECLNEARIVGLEDTKDAADKYSPRSGCSTEALMSSSRSSSGDEAASLPQTPPLPVFPGVQWRAVLKLEDALVQEAATAPAVVLDLAGALLGAGSTTAVAPPPALPLQPSARCEAAPEYPSVGSALHSLGKCRPCDFINRTDTCRAGANCRFCHICGPMAVKERRKQRRSQIRAIRQAAADLGDSGLLFPTEPQSMNLA